MQIYEKKNKVVFYKIDNYCIGFATKFSFSRCAGATNWAVWQFSPWYASNFAGLIQSYTFALPFFRNTLLGNVFYTSVLFGVYEAAIYFAKSQKQFFKLIKIK